MGKRLPCLLFLHQGREGRRVRYFPLPVPVPREKEKGMGTDLFLFSRQREGKKEEKKGRLSFSSCIWLSADKRGKKRGAKRMWDEPGPFFCK